MTNEQRGGSLPMKIRPVFENVVRLTDEVCRAHLTEEYAELSRRLAAALARRRPSPLTRGHVQTWACGIVYTLGTVNFLFDPAQSPHLQARQVCELFGVSQSSGAAKARAIMTLFDLVPLDPRWTLPSRLASNPLAWMIQINGVIVDARQLPRKLQEEAHRLGLIPFVPE